MRIDRSTSSHAPTGGSNEIRETIRSGEVWAKGETLPDDDGVSLNSERDELVSASISYYFAETFEDLIGPDQRVFSFNVAGHAFNDFDVWVTAGGPNRAYIETVPVDISNGKLDITFISKVHNPEINGIEIPLVP